MSTINTTIYYYSTHAKKFYRKYKKLRCEQVHALWLHLIPCNKKIQILDVGAGSGRDALWFVKKGHEVTAVEPADGLRELAKTSQNSDLIRWLEDYLPELQKVKSLNLKFDLILLSAVWMHVDPRQRKEAFDNLVGLLGVNGKLVITIRHGPSNDTRAMHPVGKDELIKYAEVKRLEVFFAKESVDLFGRHNVKWETVVFKRP
jgi:SAM-dependent methyltransferase